MRGAGLDSFRSVAVHDKASILVVDDEPDLRTLISTLLERAGYRAVLAEDGPEGLRLFYHSRPALVVLDVEMPGMDGWTVLTRIRELSEIPVLMLSARGAELDRVRGLTSGADDYLVKPFGPQEMIARVAALLRRVRPAAEDGEALLSDALVEVDLPKRCVTVRGTEVRLSPLELRLLVCLMRNRDQVLSNRQLLELVWDDPWGESTARVKVGVGEMRAKLRSARDEPM